MPVGRPPLYTKELAERICGHLAEGQTVTCASWLEGVSPDTVQRWVSRGNAGEEPYVEFCGMFHRARAKAEADMVARLRRAEEDGHDGWKPASWRLARSRRNDWGDKAGIELTGANGGPLQTLDVTKLSDEELHAKLAELGLAVVKREGE